MNKADPTGKFVVWWRPAGELLSHLLSKGFCCFSITYTIMSDESLSSLFTRQKQHFECITKQTKVTHSWVFFVRLLCSGMCFISLLATDDIWMKKMLASGFAQWSSIFCFFSLLFDSAQIFVMLVCSAGDIPCEVLIPCALKPGLATPVFSLCSSWWSTSGCSAWAYIFTKH